MSLPSPDLSPVEDSDDQIGENDPIKYVWDMNNNEVKANWLIEPPSVAPFDGEIGHVVVFIQPPKVDCEEIEATLDIWEWNEERQIEERMGGEQPVPFKKPQIMKDNPGDEIDPNAPVQLSGHHQPLCFTFYVRINVEDQTKPKIMLRLAARVVVKGLGPNKQEKPLTCQRGDEKNHCTLMRNAPPRTC